MVPAPGVYRVLSAPGGQCTARVVASGVSRARPARAQRALARSMKPRSQIRLTWWLAGSGVEVVVSRAAV